MPLSKLTVVDLATLAAAPQIAAFFGDFGARVIKVEHPRGDSLRRLVDARGVPLTWKIVNRNKQHVTLDVTKPEGRALLDEMLARADLLVCNLGRERLARFGLERAHLAAAHPRLVVVNLTAYGTDGPWAERPGSGTLAEAMSGLAQLVGYPDRPPLLPPLALGDNIGAIAGAFAVMTALFHRERTGEGQEIDLALVEPLLAVLGIQTLVRSVTGISMTRQGNRVNHLAPRGAWETVDGRWISVTVGNDNTFRSLAEAMGMPGLVDEPRFATNRARLANVDAIEGVLAEWFGRTKFEDAIRALESKKVAHAPLYDAEQLLSDPQLTSRRAFVQVEDEELGHATLPNVIARFSRTPGEVRYAGRPKGADNGRIYQERLGLTEEEVGELAARRVI